MLDALRYNDELTRRKLNRAVAKLYSKTALYRHEKLIFLLMMMPRKIALELNELHLLPVQLTNDLRPPVFGDQRKFSARLILFMIDFKTRNENDLMPYMGLPSSSV